MTTATVDKDDLKLYATEYVKLGFSVIPADSKRKRGAPFPWKKYQEEKASQQQVIEWCNAYPQHGLAIITGKVSGIVVIDLDRHGENDGVDFAESQFGWEPDGPIVTTGGGGLHVYCRHPGYPIKNGANIYPGIDIRGDGGFVYAPPSIHENGGYYQWQDSQFLKDELPPLPKWVLCKFDRPKMIQGVDLHEDIPDDQLDAADDLTIKIKMGVSEGKRNETAAKIAGRYIGLGNSKQDTIDLMTLWNKRNKPPLPLKEIIEVVESIERKHQGNGLAEKPGSDDERLEILQMLSKVFGVEIIDIWYVPGDSPNYRFHFPHPESENRRLYVDIPAGQLLHQNKFRDLMVVGAQRVVRKIGNKQKPGWDYYVQQMMNVAKKVNVGEEGFIVGHLPMWIQSYIEHNTPSYNMDEHDIADEPVINEKDELFIHLPHFKQFVTATFDERIALTSLAQIVATEEFMRRTVSIKMVGGKKTSRSMWQVPEAYMVDLVM